MKQTLFCRVLFSLFVICCSLKLGAMQAPTMPDVDDTAIAAPTELKDIKNTVLGKIIGLGFGKVFEVNQSKLTAEANKVLQAVQTSKNEVNEDAFNAYAEVFWSKIALACLVKFVMTYKFDDVNNCTAEIINNSIVAELRIVKGSDNSNLITHAQLSNSTITITTVDGRDLLLDIATTVNQIVEILKAATTFVQSVKVALAQYSSALIHAKVIKDGNTLYTIKEYTQSIQKLGEKLIQNSYLKLVQKVAQRYAQKSKDFIGKAHANQATDYVTTNAAQGLKSTLTDAMDAAMDDDAQDND